jgi:hypothetical protein
MPGQGAVRNIGPEAYARFGYLAINVAEARESGPSPVQRP